MKKRAISIICCMALALACVILVGCGGGKDKSTDMSNSAYVGTWKVTEVTFMDEQASADEVLGNETILELNADGTAKLTDSESVSEGVWSETSKGVKIKGDDLNVTLEDVDGKLDMSILGAHMIFEKQ